MIQVEQLGFTYAGAAKPAVDQLDFRIRSGEVLGFLGPNGAGKSTTQKVLIGLLRGYSGSVSVFGRSLAQWNSDYYERIGVSFELPNHYLKLTAAENLTYFGSLYSGRTETAAALLSLVGLERDADQPVGQFSKGMKNRLSIARALLNDPELIFLDEPTAGLDPLSARQVKELIRAQRKAGKTVFLTTHDMTVADELCDRVAFIVDGKIELIDAPRELKLRYGEAKVRVEFEQDGVTQSAEFPLEGLGGNESFLTRLRGGGIQTLHTLEASLEEIFIQVTGRGLS